MARHGGPGDWRRASKGGCSRRRTWISGPSSRRVSRQPVDRANCSRSRGEASGSTRRARPCCSTSPTRRPANRARYRSGADYGPCWRCAGRGPTIPDSAFVFGTATGEQVTTIRYAWEKACKAAGIRGLHAHNLRREAACGLLEAATVLHDVRDILGHKSVTTTNIYLSGTSARQVDAMERLNQAAEPTPSATQADTVLHTVCTNSPQAEDGRTPSLAVTH